MTKKKITIQQVQDRKTEGKKFAMITVYDYPMAAIVEESKIEMILVGDSLGMVIQGFDGTVHVNMDDMLYHLKLVRRGTPNTFIVGDMPFMAYQASEIEAIHNAGLLMKSGADCVKMEGNKYTAEKVDAVVKAGIPVMGHIGLTPQTAASFGGFKVQGKGIDSARRMLDDAIAYEQAGAFCIVLECLPTALGTLIDEKLSIPTISVGAGPNCTGQNLNAYDILGIFDKFVPKFVKQYKLLGKEILDGFDTWRDEIDSGAYPAKEHGFNVSEEDINKLREEL
jgi:3-methyl-2-oxobutanoate hydroxymethyltransferase